MHVFKVVMEGGHMGSGKSCEFVRYFEAEDAMDLFGLLKAFPGLKNKDSASGISMVKAIYEAEFERGQSAEQEDPYYSRRSKRSRNVAECIIKPIDSHSGNGKIIGRIRECSKDGFSARYKGLELTSGIKCLVSISDLGKNNKKAELVWTLAISDDSFLSGFKWL